MRIPLTSTLSFTLTFAAPFALRTFVVIFVLVHTSEVADIVPWTT